MSENSNTGVNETTIHTNVVSSNPAHGEVYSINFTW